MRRAPLAVALVALVAPACVSTASPVNVWVGSLPLAVVPDRAPAAGAAAGLFLNDRMALTATVGTTNAAPTSGGFTGVAQGYDPDSHCALNLQYSGTWSAQPPTVTLTYGTTTLVASGCSVATMNGRVTVTASPTTLTLGSETAALSVAGLTQTYTRQP